VRGLRASGAHLAIEKRMVVHHFVIVSDFNASNLAALLSLSDAAGEINATCTPFGQVMQSLLSADHAQLPPDANQAIVWTSPQGVSQSYKRRLDFDIGTLEEIDAEARQFGQALMRLPANIQHIFVPTWSASHPSLIRRGLLDMNTEMGLSLALLKMNLALHETIAADRRIHLFDSSRWTALCGDKSYDPRLWYASKTPYSLAVFKLAAADFTAALRGLRGGAKKLLVLDLDGTLWGGTVGEDGWRNLQLGGHDPVGEAYRDFQAALRTLTRRGVLLGIVSKNDERIAVEAIASHPEMVLRTEHFAGTRIDWNDKARNVVELADELNLGLDAVVFIDDNPVERDRIRQALPAVLVPEWPTSPMYYCSRLAALDCFDVPFVSTEDRNRTAMYVAEGDRKRSRQDALGLDDWLRSLELTIEVEPLSPANLPRAIQLLNKTNQLNLSTRRLSASEFMEWAEQPDQRVLVFNVTDRFGDYGLVGIGSLAVDPATATARVVDFLLSCRVFGRKVEESMFWVLEATAQACGVSQLIAEYRVTSKNAPCLTMLKTLGLEHNLDGDRFTSSLPSERPFPYCVKLRWNDRPHAASLASAT
jgi:FkbH-like protein